MERVLTSAPVDALDEPALSPVAVAWLAPGVAPGEWQLTRPGVTNTANQPFATLEMAAASLQPAERFVLALPLEAGLIHRLTLPPAEPGELEEMARIQLEKILPYPVEDVSITLQEIARSESEVIVAVETVHHDRLATLCEPLVRRGAWPARVIFHVQAVAIGSPSGEIAAFLCREQGKAVLAMCENGRLSFAQAVSAEEPEELAGELPAILLGAELEGVPTSFSVLRVDQRVSDAGSVLQAALNVPVELFDVSTSAARAWTERDSDDDLGDLSPAEWRTERLRGERSVRFRRRLVRGLAIYFALLGLGFLGAGALWLRLHWQRSQIAALRPPADYAAAADAHWHVLAPAVDPSRYLTETMRAVYECLPEDSSVLWTTFDQTARGISIQGEAPSPTAAVEFTEKLKTSSALHIYHFQAEPPAPLPNGRWRYHVSGNLAASDGKP